MSMKEGFGDGKAGRRRGMIEEKPRLADLLIALERSLVGLADYASAVAVHFDVPPMLCNSNIS